MLPWLAKSEQKQVFPEGIVFQEPRAQVLAALFIHCRLHLPSHLAPASEGRNFLINIYYCQTGDLRLVVLCVAGEVGEGVGR